MSDIPLSTVDRLDLAHKSGLLSADESTKLKAAFSDIMMWRFRGSLSQGKSHAEFDPLQLTLEERARLFKHIQAIRGLIAHSPHQLVKAPQVRS